MKRILIIDKNVPIHLILRKQLEKAGFHVIEASVGQNGIDYYRENPTDFIIADIAPPELEGLKTIIQLKKEFPLARIIAKADQMGRNGFLRYDPLQSALRFGALRTLTSPIKMDELSAVIEELASMSVQRERRRSRTKNFRIRKDPN
ncbi:response regulator [bacterium]|nr:response regulator [bacterium]